MHQSPRRGAHRLDLVPTQVIAALEAGAPSVNHVEQMAIDMSRLAAHELDVSKKDLVGRFDSTHFLTRMRAGGQLVHELLGDKLQSIAASWQSDTLRGWAAFAVPLRSGTPPQQLADAFLWAADDHFAVREWAWLGVRDTVASDLETTLPVLAAATTHADANVRRFASEVSRPRGVWARHVPELKQHPEMGLPVIGPLAPDASRYVQTSVGNWLNDVAPSRPDFVIHVCKEWELRHGLRAERAIVRALRNIRS